MSKRPPALLPTEFHGITIGADQIRCGDKSGPLVGTRAMVRDESTTHDEVTARGIFGNALVGIFTTDEIGWSFSEPVPEGFVYLVVVGEAFAFEVPVEARERIAAKEFVVAIRVAVKAAEGSVGPSS